MDYIQGILKDSPMLGTEYDYLRGGLLLRVDGALSRVPQRRTKRLR
jgi:hypothetical protein